jgi:hypothetical protein
LESPLNRSHPRIDAELVEIDSREGHGGEDADDHNHSQQLEDGKAAGPTIYRILARPEAYPGTSE